jgi:hypothetical protein
MTAAPPPGPGVDARGVPVVDPTANVLAIVEAAVKRQDDLREADANLNKERDQHQQEMALLRARHSGELRRAETERINAIRAVDVGAVAAAAAVSATQATTLAAQVATSAETLRNQVAATQTANTVALSAALDPIQKDIADLRRAQYEAQGQKTQVVETRAVNTGTRQWTGIIIAAAIAIGGLLVSAAGIIIAEIVKHKP